MVDMRFDELEKRLDKLDGQVMDFREELQNSAAINANRYLTRLHQRINVVKMPKPTNNPTKFVWTSHPQAPKNPKSAYQLTQHAKGVLEPT